MRMKRLTRVVWCALFFSGVWIGHKLLWAEPVTPIVKASPAFGKTHFIVGMPPEVVSASKVQESAESADAVVCYDLLCQGVLPQTFFSPHDDLRKALIHLIEQEKKSIKVAAYVMTDAKVVTALCDAYKRGVTISTVVDRSCLQMSGNKVHVLQKAGISVAVFDGEMGEDGAIMHNKFMLFAENMGTKALLWTGSANVTNAAYGRNHENAIVLDDQKICARYDKEFSFLIKSARKMAKN